MADSTRAVLAPICPSSRRMAPRGVSEWTCNEATRADLARVVESHLPHLTARLLHRPLFASEHAIDPRPLSVQLVHEVLPVVTRICRDGRPARRSEVIPMRFVGVRCAQQGVGAEEASMAVSGAVEAVADMLLARAGELDDLWGQGNVDEAAGVLCGLLEDFASRAVREVEIGHARMVGSQATAIAVLRARHARSLMALSAWPGDPTPRSVAVLAATGRREDIPALSHAAKEIEVHLTGAVDAGLGDDTPTHWRVVVPFRRAEAWREVHPVLRHIAVAHGLVIVLPSPVTSEPALRVSYNETCVSLPDVIGELGSRRGVLHPEDAPSPPSPREQS
jgi:hypothetical protein